ncbi:GNAT family N-acetyltransferase [Phenylobacterium deserti]|uniref:GNAT family N-acetyltransferase n=1 Tax=Phenylobacterium deserti TaxID=1914756 RepID=A0A328ASC6_9CAUL|nr:GNAT family N-acetyltransferase [Phenylobacterium deserti]RAK56606.1 GNAT family N-acetyltransferase [Phenylobacterium deserti]
MPRLVRPSLPLMASFAEAMAEGYSRDNLRPETPESIASAKDDPAWFLDRLLNPPETVILPDGSLAPRAPETVLWWARDDAFLGSVSLRWRLTPLLEQWGGHIGYTLRPSARGQGHGGPMLAAMLDYVRAEHPDLKQVMLTVAESNQPSIRVIEKNGGVLQDRVPHPWHDGEIGRRYLIEV